MKTSKPTASSYSALLMLVYALLLAVICTEVAATDNDRVPGKLINSLLEDDIILESMTNRRRQVEEQRNSSSNVTYLCSDAHLSSVIHNLHPMCLDSIAHLDVADPSYTTSLEGIMDINNVCRADCAGDFITFDELCPEHLPNFSEFLRGICSVNSHSELCAFSVERNDGSRVYKKCFVEFNAFEQCQFSCRNSLIHFMDDIGCCINTFYNDTQSILTNYLPTINSSVNPLLWEACDVPYPNECLHDSLTPSPTPLIINSPIPTQSVPPTFHPPNLMCSETTILSSTCIDLLKAFKTPTGLQLIAEDLKNTSYLCSNDCAGSYVNQCIGEAKNNDLITLLEIFCGQFTNNYCGGLISDTNHSLFHNISMCSQTTTTSGTCSDECHSSVVYTDSVLGCCAYALAVDIVTQYVGIPLIDNVLWSLCGLQPPQQCPNPFQLITNTQSTDSSNQVLLVSVIVTLSVVICIVAIIVIIITINIAKSRQKSKGTKYPPMGTNTTATANNDDDDDGMEFNQSYSRVTIQTPAPTAQENSYASVVIAPRDFTASSESLLQVLDNNTPHTHLHSATHITAAVQSSIYTNVQSTIHTATVQFSNHITVQEPLQSKEYDRVVVRVGEQRVIGENDRMRRGNEQEEEEERESDDRGFEYKTTANITRHFRKDTRGGVQRYVNINILPLDDKRDNIQPQIITQNGIYQEPHCPPIPAPVPHDSVVAAMNDTPSPQYHYILTENIPLYHYPQTNDPLLTNCTAATLASIQNTDGDDIVTEVNVSYAAGNKSPTQQQQQQFAVPTPSTRPLHKTAHSSCSNSQQKPTIKPRKSIPARQRESEICNGGGSVKMKVNVSYGMSTLSVSDNSLNIIKHTPDK